MARHTRRVGVADVHWPLNLALAGSGRLTPVLRRRPRILGSFSDAVRGAMAIAAGRSIWYRMEGEITAALSGASEIPASGPFDAFCALTEAADKVSKTNTARRQA